MGVLELLQTDGTPGLWLTFELVWQ